MKRLCALLAVAAVAIPTSADHIKKLQEQAILKGRSPAAHWGNDKNKYTQWGTHSNRLIPVYTFGTLRGGSGVDLSHYTGRKSPYRSRLSVRRMFGRLSADSHNPSATYMDHTNIADLQSMALRAGKKHIFLVVFDGMDWQTTQAAAIYETNAIGYNSGRGQGLHFQNYTAKGTSQFGAMAVSPYGTDFKGNVNTQGVVRKAGGIPGGYNATSGGNEPWAVPKDNKYLIGKSTTGKGVHAIPDSAATSTAMCCGQKTYNGAIGIDWTGAKLNSIAHQAQKKLMSVGLVTSVPISHATPAGAYAHNVSRHDYQDITRDLVGRPSVSHKDALSGVDVLIGAGWGSEKKSDSGQGSNFVSGNRYITSEDLRAIDIRAGGKYVVAQREGGVNGAKGLARAAERARTRGKRLFGFYGVAKHGHLPYQTADGKFDPPIGRSRTAEQYTKADIEENPTLAQMTAAALRVLETNRRGFWMMVEAGDVDWASHDNNLDNCIGAVKSGDAAVKVITDWVEKNSNWKDAVVIVTADHGHYLWLDDPTLLIDPEVRRKADIAKKSKTPPALMAHRGMKNLAPENTLPAFATALELRMDIELDVYLTADNELVVIHDKTVDRTTNGKGDVTKMTLAAVKKLDAGSWFDPSFKNERVPTLGEVFSLVKKRQKRPTTIAINMKTLSAGIEKRVVQEVAKYGLFDQVFVFGMHSRSAMQFKKTSLKIKTAVTTTGYNEWKLTTPADFKKAVGDNATEVLWVNFQPSVEQLQTAREAGKSVVYYSNDLAQLKRAALLPFDVICTDHSLETRVFQKQQAAERDKKEKSEEATK